MRHRADTLRRSTSEQAYLEFSNVQGSRADSIVVPLANTLFVNGSFSTSFRRKYVWQDQACLYEDVQAGNDENYALCCLESSPNLTLSATPLTPARPVVEGLGNIVRQLDYGTKGDHVVGPASKELEVMFDAYLAQTGLSSLELGVWALVVPESTLHSKTQPCFQDVAYNIHFPDDVDIKEHWSGVQGKVDLTYWVQRGAILCRVGKKLHFHTNINS